MNGIRPSPTKIPPKTKQILIGKTHTYIYVKYILRSILITHGNKFPLLLLFLLLFLLASFPLNKMDGTKERRNSIAPAVV